MRREQVRRYWEQRSVTDTKSKHSFSNIENDTAHALDTSSTIRKDPKKRRIMIGIIAILSVVAITISFYFMLSCTCLFGHSFEDVPYNCEKPNECVRCGIPQFEKRSHTWKDIEILQEATCIDIKRAKRQCETCGEIQIYHTNEPLGHDYEYTTIKDSTCTEKGKRVGICKRCHNKIETEIEVRNHLFVPSTDTNFKYQQINKCQYCGKAETEYLGAGAGSYIVGKDIKPGEYKVEPSILDTRGYYDVYDGPGRNELLGNDYFVSCSYIKLEVGQMIEIESGVLNPIEKTSPTTPNQDGKYKVGYDIEPGTYKATAKPGENGYWQIRQDCTAGAHTYKNDYFENTSYFEVSAGQYIELEGCTIVKQ